MDRSEGAEEQAGVRFEVDGFEPAGDLAERLHSLGLVSRPGLFRWYLAISAEPEPGAHWLRPGLTPRELVKRLNRSQGRPSVTITIPEGFNLYQIAARLEEKDICPAADFVRAATRRSTLLALGIQAGKDGPHSVEGYLFPATYPFGVNTSPDEVIRRLVLETRKRLDKLSGAPLLKERGWGEHEWLTLASMIEKEAQVAEERAIISSVFHNRLDSPEFEKRRFFQSDPTSVYGCYVEPELIPACAGFKGQVTPAMNRDPKNRYSTYVTQGLPPGPIASPGEASIRAAIEPAETEYLFFVAIGGGRHRFTKTYAEHQQAIEDARK